MSSRDISCETSVPYCEDGLTWDAATGNACKELSARICTEYTLIYLSIAKTLAHDWLCLCG